MFVAGVYIPPNKPLAEFTQFIAGTLEYTKNYLAVFTCELFGDVMNHYTTACNYIDVFHQFSFLNEINLPTYISASDGNATSPLYHTRHNLNGQRCSYVVSPALTGLYAVCVVFRVKQ